MARHGVHHQWLHWPTVGSSSRLFDPRYRRGDRAHHHSNHVHASSLNVAQMRHLRVRLGGAPGHSICRHRHGKNGPRQRKLVLDPQGIHGPAVRTYTRLAHCDYLLYGRDLHLCVVVHEPAFSVHGEHHDGCDDGQLGRIVNQRELATAAARIQEDEGGRKPTYRDSGNRIIDNEQIENFEGGWCR